MCSKNNVIPQLPPSHILIPPMSLPPVQELRTSVTFYWIPLPPPSLLCSPLILKSRGGMPMFPVVYLDSGMEIHVGDISTNSALRYKLFQSMISKKIGISPKCISIYLVDRSKNPEPPQPISADPPRALFDANFGLIRRLMECCFLIKFHTDMRIRRTSVRTRIRIWIR